ncbi:11688_t:CDS:1, partial [Gigaspora rosea]
VARYDETIVKKRCDKEFDHSGCKIDEFVEEVAKSLMKNKLDNYKVYDKGEIEVD